MMRWTQLSGFLILPLILGCRGGNSPISQAFEVNRSHPEAACASPELPPSGQGRILHVATNGSDPSGDGSAARPYASLKRAADRAQAGDTILVHGGTYALSSEQFITARGREDAWITIRAAPSETAGSDGSGAPFEKVILDASAAQLPDLYRGIITFGGAYVIFEGFEVRNSPGSGIKFYQAQHIRVQNNLVHHVQGLAIGGSGDFITLNANEVYAAVLSNANGAKDQGGGWLPAVASGHWDNPLRRSRNWLVTNNYVHESWGECLDALYLEDSVLQGNRVHDCYSTNIYLDNASRIQVRDNLSYVTGERFNTRVQPHRAHGITVAAESKDVCPSCAMEAIQIQGNRISGTHNGILYFDTAQGGYRDLEIADNIVWNQRREAVWIAPTAFASGSNRLTNNVLYRGLETASLGIGNGNVWTVSGNRETTERLPNLNEAICKGP
jgi:hypothetical protein